MLVLLFLLAQVGPSAAAVRELEDVEQQLAATWNAGNCTGWAALIAEDWAVIHITGETLTKSQALAMCKTPAEALQKIDDVKVRVYGTSAVVTGRNTVTVGGTTPMTVVLRFTDVFIRREGRWLAVASHATRLGP